MHLEDFITHKEPLGPYRHEVTRPHVASSAELLSKVPPLSSVFYDEANVIIGRKGAGKTAVMMAYRAYATYGRYHGAIPEQDENNVDITVPVVDFGHFHDLVRRVANRAHAEVKVVDNSGLIFSERLAEIWADEIWDLVFQTFHRIGLNSEEIRNRVPSVDQLYNTEDILDENSDYLKRKIDKLFESAKTEIEDYLAEIGKKCVVLFDSMDEYPLKNHLFARVVSGFMKCVNDFRVSHRCIDIVFCLPAEMEDFFEEHSSNILKDLGTASRLSWKPSNLLQIVADRYVKYLTLHGQAEDRDFLSKISNMDFEVRENLQFLFDSLIEPDVENSLGFKEDSLAYIIRHTHLLPREFIMLFNSAIRISRDSDGAGSKRWIVSDAIKKSVDTTENALGNHVLKPFRDIFPSFVDACGDILSELPVFSTLEDLENIERRFKNRTDPGINNVWRTLFKMGVLGYSDEGALEASERSERYVYSYFCYNATSPIFFRKGALYSIHPLFSRKWGLKRPEGYKDKFVYPANIEHFGINA